MENSDTVLGLDIGVNSIGWAILESKNGDFVSLGDIGVRVFEEGVEGGKDDIEAGREKSKAVQRREARLRRRHLRAKRARPET